MLMVLTEEDFPLSVCVPRPSALGPQNTARLNVILLFNFEVVITLKL